MSLTMKERQSLTKVLALRYKGDRKKEKKIMLNEFVEQTGYNRSYASYVLRLYGAKGKS